ncbi:MAG: helix-turn-helix domain-containing protein [Chromatiales bacterium]|nr:helix-turn-helix domain-containing protein [Chromatiales bacterium]
MPLSPKDHARIRGVTIEDAAKTLGIAKSTAYKLISRGELRTFKIGRASSDTRRDRGLHQAPGIARRLTGSRHDAEKITEDPRRMAREAGPEVGHK